MQLDTFIMTINEIDSKIKYLKSFNKRMNREIDKLRVWVNEVKSDL
jgi:prefoldin subunit 5